MYYDSRQPDELTKLKKRSKVYSIITITLLFLVFAFTLFIIKEMNSDKISTVYITDNGFKISNSDINFDELIDAKDFALLKDSNKKYYVYNKTKEFDEKKSYEEAIVIDVISNTSDNEKGIIVKADNLDWYLIDKDGNPTSKVFSDLAIDHNVVAVDIRGTFPIALKTLNLE